MQENLLQEKYLSAHKKYVDYYSFLAPTGYTQAAVDNIKSMQSVGIDISLKCVHGKMVGTGFSKNEIDWLAYLLNKKSNISSYQFLHAIPPRWSGMPKSKRRIALFVFENEKIPKDWQEKLKQCLAVIVPSRFNYDSLKNYGLDNVYLVNHAVDYSIWNDEIKMPKLEKDKIKIITIGTWKKRKNWKNMMLAMVDLCKNNKQIEWTLKTDKLSSAKKDIKEWLEEIKCTELLDTIFKIDGRILDESSMARLVASHDLLLSASLGEGFGLPALQACFAKIPVVCPNFGGYKEFFDPTCYFEIKCKNLIKINKMDNHPQFDNLEWPLYEKDSILDALYLCIENIDKAKINTKIVSEKYYNKFSHKTIGNSFLNVINNCNVVTSHKN